MKPRRVVVSLDEPALLRQMRGGAEPDLVAAATLAQLAGADELAVHLREDRMHIQDRDLRVLRLTLRRGFRMDIAPLPESLKVALEIRPDAVTLVPELPGELRSYGGLDVQTELGELGEMVRALEDGGIRAAIRLAADTEQVKAAHRAGARQVELCTGHLNDEAPDRAELLGQLSDAARLAQKLGLEVSVAGGLEAGTVRELAAIPSLTGFRVGHALVVRALLVGMERAVRELRTLVD